MRPAARLSATILAGAAMFLALLACQPQDRSGDPARQDASGGPRAVLASTRLNPGFERNVGQTDKSVQYLMRGRRHVLFLTGREVVMTLRMPPSLDGIERARPTEDGEPARAAVLRMMFEGAAAPLKIEAEQPLPTRINDYRGGGGRTPKTDIPTYGRVRYRNVWTGIDAAFSTDDGRPRYVFIVAPGADPANIRLSFSGAKEIDVAEDGDLVILTAAGEVRHSAPKVNQRSAGGRHSIAGRYVIAGTTVNFRFGAYDRTLPLVIHPTVEFSGFVGGAAAEKSRVRLAIGPDGMVYMAGTTAEPIGSVFFVGPSYVPVFY